jgi:hypothetical protein
MHENALKPVAQATGALSVTSAHMAAYFLPQCQIFQNTGKQKALHSLVQYLYSQILLFGFGQDVPLSSVYPVVSS